MACGLGFPDDLCAKDHWERSLGGGKVGQHYRLRCPVCGKNGCLEVTVKSTGILYRCWYKPPGSKKERPGCSTEAIRAELADLDYGATLVFAGRSKLASRRYCPGRLPGHSVSQNGRAFAGAHSTEQYQLQSCQRPASPVLPGAKPMNDAPQLRFAQRRSMLVPGFGWPCADFWRIGYGSLRLVSIAHVPRLVAPDEVSISRIRGIATAPEGRAELAAAFG